MTAQCARGKHSPIFCDGAMRKPSILKQGIASLHRSLAALYLGFQGNCDKSPKCVSDCPADCIIKAN